MKRGQSRGTAVCYNVPTAVDSPHKLSVACEVTNAPGDRDWLSPMALHAKEGRDCRLEVVADVGYYQGHAVKTCLEAGITTDVPRPITSANEQLGLFSKADFIYDKGTDTSQCPAGARLTFRFDTVELGRHIRFRRRHPAEAVYSRSSVRAVKAGGGLRAGSMSRCWKRWSSVCGVDGR